MQCSKFSGRLGLRPYLKDLQNALLSSLHILAMVVCVSRKGAKEVLCSLFTGPLAVWPADRLSLSWWHNEIRRYD